MGEEKLPGIVNLQEFIQQERKRREDTCAAEVEAALERNGCHLTPHMEFHGGQFVASVVIEAND